MDASSPFYLLRWSDHITNYAEVFLTLREEEEFLDCSIACDDGVVGAHRIVLAGCSPYLRDLLKRSANPHPIIFLVNVSRSTVLLLLEFIYRGQAHIPYSRLHQLVTLGKSMQIKGLSQIVLPENNPPLMARSLPIIPRLHGTPDPVTEIMSDMSERDSSNHPSPGNDDTLSGSALEDLGANSSRVNNMQTTETEKDRTSPRKQNNDIQEHNDSLINTPKKQKQKEKQLGPVQEQRRNRINVMKVSDGDAVDSSLVKKRLHDDSMPDDAGVRGKLKIKAVDQPKSKYVPKPKSKQMKRISNAFSSPERSPKTVSSKNPEEEKQHDKELQKGEGKAVRRGRPPAGKKLVKGKPAVYKVKKNARIGRVKKEPKEKLYRAGERLKLELGAYAIRHGLEMSQRYILARYGVKIRRQSLEKMISLCSPLHKNNPGAKKDTPKKTMKN